MVTRSINVALLLCLASAFADAEFDPEIVGGTPADYENYPFYAIPDLSTTNYVCGATVIYEDILLTAAHCTGAWSKDTTAVITPSGGLFDETPNETHEVDFVVGHPDYFYGYFRGSFRNDIMLVKLATSTDVTPVVLNTESTVPAVGDTLTAIGFGDTTDGGELSSELLEVNMEAIPADECPGIVENDVMICSGTVDAGICQGDSGGPLFTQGNVQIGIMSFTARASGSPGSGCGDDVPDGFTRVSAYDQWIQDGICCMSSNPPSDCGELDCSEYENCPCGRFRFLCRLLNRCLF